MSRSYLLLYHKCARSFIFKEARPTVPCATVHTETVQFVHPRDGTRCRASTRFPPCGNRLTRRPTLLVNRKTVTFEIDIFLGSEVVSSSRLGAIAGKVKDLRRGVVADDEEDGISTLSRIRSFTFNRPLRSTVSSIACALMNMCLCVYTV